MAGLERVSTNTLEKRRAEIDAELKRRVLERGGQEELEFVNLHSLPGCSISTVYVGRIGSGFFHIGFSPSEDYEMPTYQYRRRCNGHGVKSAVFESLSWIPDAVKE